MVWDRFGNVANYVEPFFGSGAVLLARPHPPGMETINDRDAFLMNFWRAVSQDPKAVAFWADWPVSEADLVARHRWMVSKGAQIVERLKDDPDFCDFRMAGWWVWGLCAWIGSGWCDTRENRKVPEQIPMLSGAQGINRGYGKLPHLRNAGMGVNRKLPQISSRGINRKPPGKAGRGDFIFSLFDKLQDRLRDVRICAGEWDRVLGPSVTWGNGLTGVFLDPPYSETEHGIQYRERSNPAPDVFRWAIENGENKLLRIALCGYEGEHEMPAAWECVEWKAVGGYGLQGNGRGRENRTRERIWFSPYCLRQPTLFDFAGEEADEVEFVS